MAEDRKSGLSTLGSPEKDGSGASVGSSQRSVPVGFVPLSRGDLHEALTAALESASAGVATDTPVDPEDVPTDPGNASIPPRVEDTTPLRSSLDFATGIAFGAHLATATAAAVASSLMDRLPPEFSIAQKQKVNSERLPAIEIPPGYNYSPTGLIVSSTFFGGTQTTGEIQVRLDKFFRRVNAAPPDEFFYYDVLGNELGHFTLPDELKALRATDSAAFRAEKQKWHNRNRIALMPSGAVCPTEEKDPGYPLVASSVVPDILQKELEAGEADSLLNRALKNLTETVESGDTHPVYFDGEKVTLYEGIRKIAAAYGVPLSLAIGLGSVERTFRHQGPDSSVGAKGIYQIMPQTFPEVRAFIQANTKYSASLRREALTIGYEEACSNLFVSTELFCAYYLMLGNYVKKTEDALEARIRMLDPNFPPGCLRELAIVNAYNAGPGNINNAMQRFSDLSDDQIRARIGTPPYGVDAWVGIIAHSFDLTVLGKHSNIGMDVFTYPHKISGLGSLICDDVNYFLQYDQLREGDEDDGSERGFLDVMSTHWNEVEDAATGLAVLTGAASVLGGGRLVAQGATRRDVLRAASGVVVAGSPLALGAHVYGTDLAVRLKASLSLLPPDTQESVEKHPACLAAEQRIDRLYGVLKDRLEMDGVSAMGWLPIEANRRKYSKADLQRLLLHAPIEDMFPPDLVQAFEAQRYKKLADRLPTYEKAVPFQAAYIAEQQRQGNLVPFVPNDPHLPIFAEQVGRNSGIGNDSDSLYLHKDFFWIFQMVVDLVNKQVRIFNEDKTLYGVDPHIFPHLAQIDAFKISGALRFIKQTVEQFRMGKGSQTTPGISIHWTGLAADVASFGPSNSHLVRFAEDQKNGMNPDSKVLYTKGDKLPNSTGGNEKIMRDLYQKMIERALFALILPLRDHFGIEMAPLYEDSQFNLHVAMLPAQYRGR